ncbi:class I SAM-dependent methyltransferase [Pseudokineococcus sp. 5B2Z-1]|uniref:class I SAM-dependent methyltransferase n=1 Tax=Pseudokineococcus sp. 5B2Z-1 TaxID=3132744 RepID=UPI00403F2E5B
MQALTDLVDPVGAGVVDLGCGGGTYSRALHDLGARSVTGVDSSTPILDQARADHGHLTGLRFHHADATSTGLPDASADLVLARALVHHLLDHAALAREAVRLLRPGGTLVVQDRTADDVNQPAGPHHLRGHLLELAPQLLPVEVGRRPDADALLRVLEGAGLTGATTRTVWETRAHHPDRESYLADVATRTGRSLLHHLTDDELDRLVRDLRSRLPDEPLVEQDRWTLWAATKP